MSRFPQGAELLPALLKESRLPGPRANLELLQQFADECSWSQAELCFAVMDQAIPADHPLEFVAMCGVAACGKFISDGGVQIVNDAALTVIRNAARHSSWRVREAAAMALHRYGKATRSGLLALVASWDSHDLLDRRCIAAALCEPDLLSDNDFALAVLKLLDEYIVDFERIRNIKSEDYKTLKKALGYCLSVAIAALPEEGKPLFENWMQSASSEVRWVLNENLKKNRLRQMDADWVDQQIEFLNDAD